MSCEKKDATKVSYGCLLHTFLEAYFLYVIDEGNVRAMSKRKEYIVKPMT